MKFKIKKIKFFFITLCVIQLIYIFHYRSGFNYEIIKNPFSKSSGINYAVSPEVIESNTLLKKNDIINFYISEILEEDTYFYQRSIEFNYPIRINKNSKFIFYKVEEKIPEACEILESGIYIKLTRC